MYSTTSSRKIQQHPLTCDKLRSSAQDRIGATDEHHSPAFTAVSLASASVMPDSIAVFDATTNPTELCASRSAPPSSLVRNISGQVDGTHDDMSCMVESGQSDNAIQYNDSSNALTLSASPLPTQRAVFPYSWEDTAMSMLLRRQQLEKQQINARHYAEIVALHVGSSAVFPGATYSQTKSAQWLRQRH